MVLDWIKQFISRFTDRPIFKGIGVSTSPHKVDTEWYRSIGIIDGSEESPFDASKPVLERCYGRIATCRITPNETVYEIVGTYRNEEHNVLYYKLKDPISGEEINIGRIHFKKFFTIDKK